MRALILSGGNLRGAWQVGRLRRIVEQEGAAGRAGWDFVSGTSVGALNALKIANDLGAVLPWQMIVLNLNSLWLEIQGPKDLARERSMVAVLLDALRNKEHKGLADMSPLLKLVKSKVSTTAIRACPIPVLVTTADYVRGTVVRHDLRTCNDPIMAAFVSAMEPVIMQGVVLNCDCQGLAATGSAEGTLHQDGGVYDIAPLRSAIKAGTTSMTVILTQAPFSDAIPVPGPWPLLKLVGRTVGVMTDETLSNDLEDNLIEDLKEAVKINEELEDDEVVSLRHRIIPIEIHRPSKHYAFSVTNFKKEDIITMLEDGYYGR